MAELIKTVFLDIDGVMVTANTLEERAAVRFGDGIQSRAAVRALNFLTSATGAGIVLSSSWRFCGLAEMQAIFNLWGVMGELVGLTPSLCREEAHGKGKWIDCLRADEITAYFDAREGLREQASYVMLDDMSQAEFGPGHGDRLIKVNPSQGLSMHDAERAIQIVGKREWEW